MEDATSYVIRRFLELEAEKRKTWSEPNRSGEIQKRAMEILLIAYSTRGVEITDIPPEAGHLLHAIQKIARIALIGDPRDPAWMDSVLDAMIYILRASVTAINYHKGEEEEDDEEAGNATHPR